MVNPNIQIRQACIADKEAIFEFIRAAYPNRWQYKIPDRWEWEFEKNPFWDFERLPIWIAIDLQTQKIIGQSCAMIECFQLGEQSYPLGWGVDFYVLPPYRGQGLGTKLQMANNIAHQVFMSLSMATQARQIKRKMGMQELPSVPIFTKILQHHPASVRQTLGARLTPHILSQKIFQDWLYRTRADALITTILNRRTQIQIRRLQKTSSLDIHILPIKTFDASFNDFWKQVSPAFAGGIRRDCTYLNWKFSHQPHVQHLKFVAKRQKQICGYIILRRSQPPERNIGIIVDLLTFPQDRVTIRMLLAHASIILFQENVDSIQIASSILEYQTELQRLGFHQVQTTNPIVRWPDVIRDPTSDPQKPWLFSKGDHDWDQYPLA